MIDVIGEVRDGRLTGGPHYEPTSIQHPKQYPSIPHVVWNAICSSHIEEYIDQFLVKFSFLTNATVAAPDIIPSNAISPCLSAHQILICLSSKAMSAHFLPLFLMPWEPVLRGPLLPLTFAAKSALAFASAQFHQRESAIGAWYPTYQPFASPGKLYLHHPSLPLGLSSGPSKA
ncbi:hypothetical protein VTL71DRAFT_1352 [Oculimacula yallundae]|uniref:Uncharacterized protein n=1 Tax=Oculimacula yallundae TaxID=86028 RepID=A0ABR4CAF6_9HELO